jgi:WhiB family transcriptional regulator, redox-sensing transcriptional regulator
MADIRLRVPRRPAWSAATSADTSEDTDWRDHAACRDTDPELFFPIGNAGPALVQVARAKQLCAACQARTPCLEWALATGQDAGVWGGTSEDERRALRRSRRISS